MKVSDILITLFFVLLTIKLVVVDVALSWLVVFSPLLVVAGVIGLYLLLVMIASLVNKVKRPNGKDKGK